MSNGPRCVWCEDGDYYDCGDPPHCEDGTPTVAKVKWTEVGEVELHAGTIYYLKCKPGCDATVDTDPTATNPWRVVGQVTVGNGSSPEGIYKLFCATGGKGGCRAALKYDRDSD